MNMSMRDFSGTRYYWTASGANTYPYVQPGGWAVAPYLNGFQYGAGTWYWNENGCPGH